jgi:hypothetical protein
LCQKTSGIYSRNRVPLGRSTDFRPTFSFPSMVGPRQRPALLDLCALHRIGSSYSARAFRNLQWETQCCRYTPSCEGARLPRLVAGGSPAAPPWGARPACRPLSPSKGTCLDGLINGFLPFLNHIRLLPLPYFPPPAIPQPLPLKSRAALHCIAPRTASSTCPSAVSQQPDSFPSRLALLPHRLRATPSPRPLYSPHISPESDRSCSPSRLI